MSLLKIFVAHPTVVVRAGLKAIINKQDDLHVVGDCADASAALARIPELSPDLAVMASVMPPLSGVA